MNPELIPIIKERIYTVSAINKFKLLPSINPGAGNITIGVAVLKRLLNNGTIPSVEIQRADGSISRAITGYTILDIYELYETGRTLGDLERKKKSIEEKDDTATKPISTMKRVL